MKRYLLAILLTLPVGAMAQESEPENQFTTDIQLMARGEIRNGGLPRDAEESTGDQSSFVIGRSRLIVGYERPMLQAKLNIQHSGVWGQSGKGSINVYEAWAKLTAKNGLFAQVGRQTLSYDDERIIGPNDWAMAGISHDVLKLGYEGHGHKLHAILAYNQNAENMSNGSSFYKNGSMPYKSMQTVWYHFDVPNFPLGASLLFMNIGMQSGKEGGVDFNAPRTEWQQLYGGYVKFAPKLFSIEGSYYRQGGHNEYRGKINAWMTSVKGTFAPSPVYGFEAGYDYLRGDEYFAIPPEGGLGLIRHDVIKGFNPVYGSHHKFYGAMDFFYVTTYVNGFTPGLQNLFFGAHVSPLKGLRLSAAYHYYATAAKLDGLNKTLGHDIELEASYRIMKDVNLAVGFSYMNGTETMEKLKRASNDGSMRWGWVSLNITPRIFTTKW